MLRATCGQGPSFQAFRGSDCWVPDRRRGRLADAAEPASVAFAFAGGSDRLDEAAQGLVRGSTAVARVLRGRGAGDLAGDGLDRAIIGGSRPTVPSARRRGWAAHGGMTSWPSRPLILVVTWGGPVQQVARSATAPGSVLVRS